MKRSPLRPMSSRRRTDLDTRAKVRAEVLERDNNLCQFWHYAWEAPFRDDAPSIAGAPIDCAGPLDVHEIIPRSAWAGGWLVPANCVTVCRTHHQWVTEHPAEAHGIGLHGWSWERPA